MEDVLAGRGASVGPRDDEAALAALERLSLAIEDESGTEPLALLYRRLDLTLLEFQVVLLCLAPELDPKYQTVFGVFNDDLGRRTVSLSLACALLGDPLSIRDALTRSAGLVRWRLLEDGAALPHGDEALRLESTLIAWLLGNGQALFADPRVSPLVLDADWPAVEWWHQPLEPDLAELLRAAFSGRNIEGWIALTGDDADGWRALLETFARRTGHRLVRSSLVAVANMEPLALGEGSIRLARATRLTAAVAVLDATGLGIAAGEAGALRRCATAFASASCPAIVLVPALERVLSALPPGTRAFERAVPQASALEGAFYAAAKDIGVGLEPREAGRLAAMFPLSLGGVLRATRIAELEGAADLPAAEQFAALSAACRSVAAPELPRFARCVQPVFKLDDLVLPEDRRLQLDEMVSHVFYAGQVMNGWGFNAKVPYGRGVAALFWGPSGTGKTMAAQAVAEALKTQAYVVDLSRVISKFIGESEKNLDCVFSDAERAGAVLLFDEADAIFGKRSEIKDAHDRYANIEVAYLLQRLEAFNGLAILTTNFRQNVDQAFLRRLRFVVEFPKPDAAGREAIWRQCLPERAPRDEDLDLAALARRLDITGATIHNITLCAAFAAASEGAKAIAMRHILHATRAELRKLGMPIAQRDLADFEQRPAKRVA